MTCGILACGLTTRVINGKQICGVKDSEEVKRRATILISSTFLFDLVSMITLITVGSLVLKGRIQVPTKVGIGLLSGAGGIVVMTALPILTTCCKNSSYANQSQSLH